MHPGFRRMDEATVWQGGDSSQVATAKISLIALAPSPEACLDELRKAAAAAGAPTAAAPSQYQTISVRNRLSTSPEPPCIHLVR